MPFTDLIQQHFIAADITAVDDAIQKIELAILPKSRSLTPEESQKYGSINEQNKLFANKAKDNNDTQPDLSSPDVNWSEFNLDYADRSFLDTRIQRLEAILGVMKDTKILHDSDNYENALVDKSYTDYKAEKSSDGRYQNKSEEYKQFFPRTGSGGTGGGAPTT